jgi:hypothetical protein
MRMRSWILTLGISGLAMGCSDGVNGAADEGSTAGAAGAGTGSGGQAAENGGGSSSGGSNGQAGGGTSNPGAAGTPAMGGHAGSSSTGGGGGVGGSGGAGGGGSGSGGAGGSGGIPHVVGACDGLGAVDHFENITPPAVDPSVGNGIVQILVDPIHAGTVFSGTKKKGLYKSTNCGAAWTKVNTGRNAAVLDSGILWSMALDPVDTNVIYAGSLYGSDVSLFKSINGGVDWDSTAPPGSEIYMTVQYNFFQDLGMDPTDHKHVVVTFHSNCTGPTGPQCMAETKDSGATWRLFKGPLGGWGEGAGPLVLGATTWLLGTTQNGLFYTSDSGATWEKVAPGADHQMYHSPSGSFYTGSDYGVNRSSDGHKWTQIAGSPNGYGIIGDGKRLFNSLRSAGSNQQPYFTASESDPTKWTTFASPNMAHGTVYFGYDADHHVLYSANTNSGLWRMVTQ